MIKGNVNVIIRDLDGMAILYYLVDMEIISI